MIPSLYLLVLVAFDLHDNVVSLRKPGVCPGFEAISPRSACVCGIEGRALILPDVGADKWEELEIRLLLRICDCCVVACGLQVFRLQTTHRAVYWPSEGLTEGQMGGTSGPLC